MIADEILDFIPWKVFYDPKQNNFFLLCNDENGYSAYWPHPMKLGKRKLEHPERYGCIEVCIL